MRIGFWNGQRTILKRDAMLIRIRTDAGVVGYAPGPAHQRADQEIREIIGGTYLALGEFDIHDRNGVLEIYEGLALAADMPERRQRKRIVIGGRRRSEWHQGRGRATTP